MSKQLAELLLKDKIINPNQFIEAREAVNKGAKSYVRYLIEKKYVAQTKLVYYLSQKYGLPSVNLSKFEINPAVLGLVPRDVILKLQALPIQMGQDTVIVGVCDPTNPQIIDQLRFALRMNVDLVLTTYSAFDAVLQRHFEGVGAVGQAIQTFKKENQDNEKESQVNEVLEITGIGDMEHLEQPQEVPVIAAVNGILSEAIRRRASDIHVESYEHKFRVRMRIDGSLYEIAEFPKEMKRSVIARIKVIARLDIGETRVPQDGRIKLKFGGSDIDFRVSTMPTLFGEKIVLRLLDKKNLNLDMMKLGFETAQLDIFKKGIEAPNGMVLVTGPTGSGKTTTLYSALAELNKITENLSTAEDPVEYNLEGINQVQVHKDIGLTFASVLRTLLRQDPDVVLVGEIRDYETAEVAIQAALTGHLVLSTLHTNDAAATITRLMNMGVEPFLICSAVNTIVAQRLVRKVCEKCKVDEILPKEQLLRLGVLEKDLGKVKSKKGQGCPACNESGYKGRIAIYEVLDFTSKLKEMVLRGENIMEIKRQAIVEGLKTLRQSALTKAFEGATTLEEALALTSEH